MYRSSLFTKDTMSLTLIFVITDQTAYRSQWIILKKHPSRLVQLSVEHKLDHLGNGSMDRAPFWHWGTLQFKHLLASSSTCIAIFILPFFSGRNLSFLSAFVYLHCTIRVLHCQSSLFREYRIKFRKGTGTAHKTKSRIALPDIGFIPQFQSHLLQSFLLLSADRNHLKTDFFHCQPQGLIFYRSVERDDCSVFLQIHFRSHTVNLIQL